MKSPYRLPAEWELHEATWIAWPHEKSDWPGKFAPIAWVYGDIVRHLSRVEVVRVIVRDEKEERTARRICEQSGADLDWVEFFHAPTDRSWLRDTAPIFVKQGAETIALDWRFTAWAKYSNFGNDDFIAAYIATTQSMKRVSTGVVLEGGGIDSNGDGLLLVTEEWLLSDTQVRNPGYTRAQYEDLFRKYFGTRQTIWLERGIEGDDTHGHIDDLARFVSADTVATLDFGDAAARLKRAGLRVVKLPQPEPVYFDGQLLPASYANFYVANGLVLVPTFNDPADRVALNTLAKVFPDRDVVGVACRDLVLGLGALHCMTMQQPA
ncbi:MAG: agmatine deiminase family protein [Bryobacteraceae bacterium]|nr:agmatine deiminase family protein [Bryobacteraceae bacterium]